jgi:hypothetical protein
MLVLESYEVPKIGERKQYHETFIEFYENLYNNIYINTSIREWMNVQKNSHGLLVGF